MVSEALDIEKMAAQETMDEADYYQTNYQIVFFVYQIVRGDSPDDDDLENRKEPLQGAGHYSDTNPKANVNGEVVHSGDDGPGDQQDGSVQLLEANAKSRNNTPGITDKEREELRREQSQEGGGQNCQRPPEASGGQRHRW